MDILNISKQLYPLCADYDEKIICITDDRKLVKKNISRDAYILIDNIPIESGGPIHGIINKNYLLIYNWYGVELRIYIKKNNEWIKLYREYNEDNFDGRIYQIETNNLGLFVWMCDKITCSLFKFNDDKLIKCDNIACRRGNFCEMHLLNDMLLCVNKSSEIFVLKNIDNKIVIFDTIITSKFISSFTIFMDMLAIETDSEIILWQNGKIIDSITKTYRRPATLFSYYNGHADTLFSIDFESNYVEIIKFNKFTKKILHKYVKYTPNKVWSTNFFVLHICGLPILVIGGYTYSEKNETLTLLKLLEI
jgi:hypothetical protein